MKRFVPAKRAALDGRIWWVVYDNLTKDFSTYTCHGRYTKKYICQHMIDWGDMQGYYKNEII